METTTVEIRATAHSGVLRGRVMIITTATASGTPSTRPSSLYRAKPPAAVVAGSVMD
ncbi:hypothetical protein FQZ97_1127410 [compost metagenome]